MYRCLFSLTRFSKRRMSFFFGFPALTLYVSFSSKLTTKHAPSFQQWICGGGWSFGWTSIFQPEISSTRSLFWRRPDDIVWTEISHPSISSSLNLRTLVTMCCGICFSLAFFLLPHLYAENQALLNRCLGGKTRKNGGTNSTYLYLWDVLHNPTSRWIRFHGKRTRTPRCRSRLARGA